MGKSINKILQSSDIILLDCAMGTMLQNNGLLSGECPELWNIIRPQDIKKIHNMCIQAGSIIIQTNTFGANKVKLSNYNLHGRVEEINYQGVAIARETAQNRAFVAGSIGPTGRFMEPIGDLSFDEAYEIFKEQALAFYKAGADLISIETMSDLGEVRAAVIAVKENTDLPVICQMTFEPKGRTITGTDTAAFVHVAEALEVDIIGANCSGGPEELLPVMREIGRLTNLPMAVQPNAGLPQLVGGKTVFKSSPSDFAGFVPQFIEAGVSLIGGCCGTEPEHIRALKSVIKGKKSSKRDNPVRTVLTSRTRSIYIGRDYEPAFIGDKINPTGRPLIARDLKEGCAEFICQEAKRQWEAGAPILDVNVGISGINHAEAMGKALKSIQKAVDCSVAIDSTVPEVIESGLKAFIGKPLVNSVNGEDIILEGVLPLVKKYGASLLGLVLDEKGIPETAEERLKIAEKIVSRAVEYGIKKENIFIDCLVLSAGVHQQMVMESLKTIGLVKKKLKVNTLLGTTNISHGMPCREILNAVYLAMAYGAGLDLPIINPLDIRMREVIDVYRVFNGTDTYGVSYINKYKGKTVPYFYQGDGDIQMGKTENSTSGEDTVHERIKNTLINGNKDGIEKILKEALDKGCFPEEIFDKALIPGMEYAGDKYEKGSFFLPQLLLTAETMKKATNFLKPYMAEGTDKSRGTVVICTVEGDIHDIGKNIVAIMIENYGFKVVDLGKDVPASRIVQAVKEYDADIVALSALMTTTMVEMPQVIKELKESGLNPFVMVGGAVVTDEYAREIGADGFAADARGALKEAQRLMGIKQKRNVK